MSILLTSHQRSNFSEPLWLPAPERPPLPVDEIHVWRASMEEPRWNILEEDCPVDRERAHRYRTALFRDDIIERYTDSEAPSIVAGPACGLRIAVAQSEHVALIAVSRSVRELGLGLERVRHDIPFEEMAGGFLDPHSQWDLRVTWSPREKAWKFFQIWTSNEACAQASPSSHSTPPCHVRGFSPEADFLAALAFGDGPAATVLHWDWM